MRQTQPPAVRGGGESYLDLSPLDGTPAGAPSPWESGVDCRPCSLPEDRPRQPPRLVPRRLPGSRGVTLHPGVGLCPTGPEGSRGDRLVVSAQLGPGLEPVPVAAPAPCKGRRGPGAIGGIRPLAQAHLSLEVGAGDALARVLSTQALDVSTKACFVCMEPSP